MHREEFWTPTSSRKHHLRSRISSVGKQTLRKTVIWSALLKWGWEMRDLGKLTTQNNSSWSSLCLKHVLSSSTLQDAKAVTTSMTEVHLAKFGFYNVLKTSLMTPAVLLGFFFFFGQWTDVIFNQKLFSFINELE